MNLITIFTDGSSRGNPGPGGWGSVIVTSQKHAPGSEQGSKVESKAHIIELGGGEKNTTNNRMELIAVIEGLKEAGKMIQVPLINDQKGSQVTVYTDSSYVINGITKWIHGWKKNGWITKAENDVLNKDLWMELDEVLNVIGYGDVFWKYVGGHVGIAGNERCDVIATSFANGEKIKLYDGAISNYLIQNILDISFDETKAKVKKSLSSRSKAPAYSYISAMKGEVKVHRTWAECEKRVRGIRGARYKKALNASEEKAIMAEFGTSSAP